MFNDARHKVFLEVNEYGTEGAAVTSLSSSVCFAAGTPIWTPDGDKLIEDIQVGDLVFSRSECHDDGSTHSKKVEAAFTGSAEIWELQIDGQVLRVTELHRFFVKGKGWTSVGEMKIGEAVSSNDTTRWLAVEAIIRTGEVRPVYNFRVADDHTYFVGKRDWGFHVWTHNCYGPPSVCPFSEFRADRPFHFIVRDNRTSSILFLGRMDDPTQTENSVDPSVAASSPMGDFNNDAELGVADADALVSEILAENNRAAFDLNTDGVVDQRDER